MGRPKVAVSTKRRTFLGAKFTDDEEAQLRADVLRLGVASLSDLFRQRVLSGRVVVRKSAELCAEDRVALHRLGVNLNQVARHLNERSGELPAIAAVSDDLAATLAQLNAILLRVGHGA